MFVHAVSPYICEPVNDLDAMKADLKKYTDFFFRRVNKFILLSLMGVHRCVQGRDIDASVAVYLSTENGNLGDTETVLHQMYRENSFPKPFNFINTMSNTASFYVAQSLKSLGRSITVSSKNVSFERGLDLAAVDFELGHIREALVGGVDEAVVSREHFIRKYDACYHDVKLLEGSSWLYLKSDRSGAIGEISGIRSCSSKDEAMEQAREDAGSSPVVSFGILMPPREKETLAKELPVGTEFDYIRDYGFYDTAASFAASKFFESFNGKTFLHINKNMQGQYVVLACKKY